MNKPDNTSDINPSPASADLLIELGCEELPPKSLANLGQSLFSGFLNQLKKAELAYDEDNSRFFYTPRRLALLVSGVSERQPDQVTERKGPAVVAAFDADKQPTPAANGFARSVGKRVEELETLKTDAGEWLFCRLEKPEVRRRRECNSCEARFTTYESPLLNMPMVIKSDGSRDAFDEVRLRSGMMRALEKRPVSAELIEDAVSRIKKQLLGIEAREISTRKIGDMVMHELQRLDHVAYIRFASVYLSFEDIQAFEEVIQTLAAEPTPEMQRRQVPLIEEDE